MGVRRPRVAVLDDDEEFAGLIEALLEEEGFAFARVAANDNVVTTLSRTAADVAIVGIGPAGGIELVRRIRAEPDLRGLPILVCSADAYQMRAHAAELASMDGVAALEKPFRIEALTGALGRLLAGSLHPPTVPVRPDAHATTALTDALHRLGTTLRWPVVDAWVPDARPGILRCAGAWAASARLAAFADVSRRTLLPYGGGLPGRIWVSGRPAWIEDLGSDMNFPRLKSARRIGLVSAAAVPVADRGELVGVVASYDQRLRRRDDAELARLVDAISDIGPILRAAAGLARPPDRRRRRP